MKDKAKYLHDILESITYIGEYLGKRRSFEIYTNKRQLRRSVERELEIIGEAMNNLLKLDPNISISDSRKIVGLRNIIIHAYDSVDDALVWDIIENHLPLLKTEITELLKN